MLLGVDLGGTKIEVAALDAAGEFLDRRRVPTPPNYRAAISAICELIAVVETKVGSQGSVGIGTPGSISPSTGLMRNANSVWLNGQPLQRDLAAALHRPVRVANDANCLALSEATDGAGAGFNSVFAVILGTGCGGGIVVNGHLQQGGNGIAGEWGHTPLPWQDEDESAAHDCWCGRRGCLETFVSGPALRRDYVASLATASAVAEAADAIAVVEMARAGQALAQAAMKRFVDRLGRGLAVICNILDPDVIVLGGGLSNVGELYRELPMIIGRHVFADGCATKIVQARHGDSSGVRGAAWLWRDVAPVVSQ